MGIALTCACGAHFEVDETYAGQAVCCPDCHHALKAPAVGAMPRRTSGHAIVSLVLALTLAFTVVGSVAAILAGFIALASIARHPQRVTGAGYAVAGIVLGFLFTGLTIFALSKTELFEAARAKILATQVDCTGPMEIRDDSGFSIRRPSEGWGVAQPRLRESVHSNANLLLADPGDQAFFEVKVRWVGPTPLAACQEQELAPYRSAPADHFSNRRTDGRTGYTLRESRHLAPVGQASADELLFDVQLQGQPTTCLMRLIKDEHGGRLFVLRGWAPARLFRSVEPEIRKALDSFRLLGLDEMDDD